MFKNPFNSKMPNRHGADMVSRLEDAIFSCWDFGKPKKVLWRLPKVFEKISFLKGKKITNKIFVQKVRPLMAKSHFYKRKKGVEKMGA